MTAVSVRSAASARNAPEELVSTRQLVNRQGAINTNIAFVSTFSPHMGGEAEYFYNLAKSVSASCHATAVANIERTAASLEASGNLRIRRVWRVGSFFYPFRIALACATIKPNLVHVNHEYMLYGRPVFGAFFPFLLLMLRLTRCPIVITMHSIVPLQALGRKFFRSYGGSSLTSAKRVSFILWTKLVLRLSDHIIVHSNASKYQLTAHYSCPAAKISVAGLGVDDAPAKGKEEARRLLKLPAGPVILNFGFLHEKKGLENLLRAMPTVLKTHPDALLVIAGGRHAAHASRSKLFPEYVSRLIGIVKELGIVEHVLMKVGYVPGELVPLYMASADIVVLPYIEQFGGSAVLAKAMAAGRPVVATRISPFCEVILDGINGLLVAPNRDEQLANAISRLLTDKSMAENLGRNLKQSARDLLWENIGKWHLELYRLLVARKSYA